MKADPHGGQRVLTAGRKLAEAAGAVVLLHGRGASAEDILGLGRELGNEYLAFFAPQAAEHSWYPYSFLALIQQNEPWLTSALNRLRSIIDDISNAGIERAKIVIAGFSQGACLATEFVARNPARYGGLLAFSGGLIGPPGTEFRYAGKLDGTPAFFGGVDPDAHVPWQRVQESAAVLAALSAEVIVKRYPGMPHAINQAELEQARNLISRIYAGKEVV